MAVKMGAKTILLNIWRKLHDNISYYRNGAEPSETPYLFIFWQQQLLVCNGSK